MAVSIVGCYFLPFLFFFIAQIAFPKSLIALVLGISALSLSCLILYFQMLNLKNARARVLQEMEQEMKQESKQEMKQEVSQTPVAIQAPAAQTPKFTFEKQNSALADIARTTLFSSPKHSLKSHKAVIAEQEQALLSQKNLFTEELEKKTLAIQALQKALDRSEQALSAKEAELAKHTKELADLKFEMYTLLRIESYVDQTNSQNTPTSNKLAAASF